MDDHRVRERAVVQVVTGRVVIESSGETLECDAGTLLTFEPSERHTVQALENARLLLILAPWPAPKHYAEGEKGHDDLPDNAMAEPVPSADTVAGPHLSERPES